MPRTVPLTNITNNAIENSALNAPGTSKERTQTSRKVGVASSKKSKSTAKSSLKLSTKSRSISKKKSRPNLQVNFKRYIFKVNKEVNPGNSISSKAMTVMNDFVKDFFGRLSSEASNLAKITKNKTILMRDIQSATKLVLRGKDLAREAINKGMKAMKKYNASKK